MPECGCTLKVYCGDGRLLRKREDEKYQDWKDASKDNKPEAWERYSKAADLRREHRDKALKRGAHA